MAVCSTSYKPGQSGNPAGRPPSIFQSLSDRRAHYLKTLSRSEILSIAESDEKLDKYSSFDAQVLIGLADTLHKTPEEKRDPSKARENFYDRELGKSVSRTELTGKDGGEIQLHHSDDDDKIIQNYLATHPIVK